MARGERHHLARGGDSCYDADALENVDMQAIFFGAVLLGVGFVLGRRGRATSAETLRVSLEEMRAEGAKLHDRVARAEEQSARNGRSLDRLLRLLPADVRNRLSRDSHDG